MKHLVWLLLLIMACPHTGSDPSNRELTGPRLLILQTDYMTGLYGEFFAESMEFSTRQGPAAGDVLLGRGFLGPIILQRSQSDSLLVLDRETLTIDTEWPLDAGSNIHDAQVVGDHLFIAAYGRDELLILDKNGQQQGALSLADYLDRDGLPEAHQLHLINDKLYLTLQNLDFSQGLEPQVPAFGRVLVIDPLQRTIENEIQIPANPLTDFVAMDDDDHFLLGCNGTWDDLDTGGLFKFNPESPESGELFISKSELGGDLTSLHALAFFDDRIWVTISAQNQGSKLLSFDVQGQDRRVHWETDDWSLSCVQPVLDRVWLCDRTPGQSGLRHSVDDFKALIETRLPPSQVLFLD